MRTRSLLPWLFAAALLIIVCVAFVDRPIAHAAHALLAAHAGWRGAFHMMTRPPEILESVLAPALIVFGVLLAVRPVAPRWMRVALAASVSLAVANAVRASAKLAFGRTWPETWTEHNPSLIATNTYGFFPFHGGLGWSSFPSGHMIAVASVISVLWLAWPRGRWLYATVAGVTAIGLLGLDFHFVSDILAGACLGWAIGLVTSSLMATARA